MLTKNAPLSFALHHMPTSMGRRALVAKFWIKGEAIPMGDALAKSQHDVLQVCRFLTSTG